MTDELVTLDTHAHFDPKWTPDDLADSGAVVAFTLSPDEAERVVDRTDPLVIWGVGCYPRHPKIQQTFDPVRFRALAERLPMIGEVGLDAGSRPPIDLQRRNFRTVLEITAELRRPVSIHSYRSTGLVLEELSRIPTVAPILHWWTGSADETSLAVELGCYFSVHSAVARHSKFRTRVPRERLLIESDNGFSDPPRANPCRVEWVEHLLAQQLGMTQMEVRRLNWHNFRTIVQMAGIEPLLPRRFAELLASVA